MPSPKKPHRVWVEVPPSRVEPFWAALGLLRNQSPGKTTSQLIEAAVLAQAARVDADPPIPIVADIGVDARIDRRILKVIYQREEPTARDIRVYTKTIPVDYIRAALARFVRDGLVETMATSHSMRFRLTDKGRGLV